MTYDVVIAGGGPVGLFLACELRLAGVAVLVLERLDDPHTPLKSNAMGSRGLNFPSVEAFYRRGLLPAVRESAIGWMTAGQQQAIDVPVGAGLNAASLAPRFAGHFAGIMLDGNKIDFSQEKYTLGGPSASGGLVSLEAIEALLAERAKELGVVLRYGAAVTDFTEDHDGVHVQLGRERICAAWLVGCDGGRSIVRKRAGFEFIGTDPELTGYVAVTDIADPEKLRPGWNVMPRGMYVNGPVRGRISVVEFDKAAGGEFEKPTGDRSMPVTLAAMQASLRRVSETDVTLTALHLASRYTDHARQAATYRKGHVLLAGDAAHVHSPFGGQGMNLGIGDAMNLGWKLAATIKGWASEALLDTYTTERHPIGAWALEWTRAQVAILRPEPHARAMAAVVREFIDTPAGATFFAKKISGIWLRYLLPGDHPLIGHSAPDFEWEDGTRLGALLEPGTGLLVDFNGNRDLQSLGQGREDRLQYVSAKAKNQLGLAALLIRPDGFVAWAADGEPDLTQAAAATREWFGTGRFVSDRLPDKEFLISHPGENNE
jgi:2-polyprenyl-6-methoxyphenol hydroxylase-like FAD-dependent oxidoreductase